MFEVVKCLREKSSPTASMSMETTKPEEVKEQRMMNLKKYQCNWLDLYSCLRYAGWVPVGTCKLRAFYKEGSGHC